MTASQKLGEKMYADQAAAQAAAGGGAQAPHAEQPQAAHAADDNIVDADFTEVKKS